MSGKSPYQNRIIRNYYKNRDAISLQRAQEILTDLYLATGKKRQRQWDLLCGHLEKLGVASGTIDHLRSRDDPALVASLITRLDRNTDAPGKSSPD